MKTPPPRMPMFTDDWLKSVRAEGLDARAGRYSYGRPEVQWRPGDNGAYSLRIGAFCSIGKGCSILVGTFGAHEKHLLSTYPIALVFGQMAPRPRAGADLSVSLGSDVWIGQNVTILAGVRIGHGAIIGASTLVNRDVPPYAIFAGIPAKRVGMRFEPRIVERLIELRWWDLPDEILADNKRLFGEDDIEPVLARLEEIRRNLAEADKVQRRPNGEE